MELENEKAKELLKAVQEKDVLRVYSGKPGCMCGCRGNYRFNSLHVAKASENRGYEVEAKEINDKQVRKVLNLLKAQDNINSNGNYFYAEINGRAYAVYLD